MMARPIAQPKAVIIRAPRSDWRRSARPVTNGSAVKRETAGTAVMIPIQPGSIPIAFSQTGKNGRWVPTRPNSVA